MSGKVYGWWARLDWVTGHAHPPSWYGRNVGQWAIHANRLALRLAAEKYCGRKFA